MPHRPGHARDAFATRNGGIDLIRGASILLVLFHHFNIAYTLRDTSLSGLVGWGAVHAVARNGNYGVTMFFAASGFLITGAAQRRWGRLADVGLLRFYRLRAARVLPCLLLVVALVNALGLGGVAIFADEPGENGPVSLAAVDAAALTFWMNVLVAREGWVNYALCALWSLSVEEVFYLAFPLLCRALRTERRLVAAFAVFVVAGPLWRAAHQDDEGQFLFAYLACFDGIAIGCIAALLAGRRRLAVPAPLRLAVAAGMAALYLAAPIAATEVWGVTLMALGTAVLLVAASRGPRRSARSTFAPVRACGRLSYELYLFHLVVLGLLRTAAPPETTVGDLKLALLLAYAAASVAAAVAVGRLYSEPLNAALRRQPFAGVRGSAERVS